MALSELESDVQEIRRVHRFYTAQIGLLDKGLLESAFSLTEVRVLYELAHREQPTATELARELGLDAGYLSRILSKLERLAMVRKRRSETDGRCALLRLTKKGRSVFADLDARANRQIVQLVGGLSAGERRRLVGALKTIETVLGGTPRPPAPFLLRSHRAGDLGWVVQRHGALYAQEHGWDQAFEALVARIVADFVERYDPARERCWIAERDGEPAGSVFLVRKTDAVAQLRLLLVEPWARGLGIGRRLVAECTRFAREAGYERITLWTNDVLVPARRIYERAGYHLVDEAPHHSFGHALVGQNWELGL